MKRLHIYTSVAFAALLAVGTTACGSNSSDSSSSTSAASADSSSVAPAPDKVLRVGLVLPDISNPFINPIATGAQSAADELGIELLVTGTNDPVAQVSAMENYIGAGVDALGFNSIDAVAMGAAVEKANEAGIPTFAVVSGTSVGDLESLISADFKEAGRLVGELIGSGWCADKDPCNVGIVQGALADEAGLAGDTGLREGLAKYPNVMIVAEAPTNYDANEAFNVAQNMLTANPDLNFIHAWWSSGSLSVVEAVGDANKTGDVGVSSLTGACTVLQELIDGKIYADAMMFPELMGAAFVRAAHGQLTNDETVELLVNTAIYPITTDTANEILADPSKAPADLPEALVHLEDAKNGNC